MPADYDIFPASALVHVTVWGVLGRDDLLHALERYGADRRASPAHQYLLDLSRVDSVELDFDGVSRHVRCARGAISWRAPQCATAIFAPGDVAFGTGRMIQSLGDGVLFGAMDVFRDRDAACAFLGLPCDGALHAWLDRRPGAGPCPDGARP